MIAPASSPSAENRPCLYIRQTVHLQPTPADWLRRRRAPRRSGLFVTSTRTTTGKTALGSRPDAVREGHPARDAARAAQPSATPWTSWKQRTGSGVSLETHGAKISSSTSNRKPRRADALRHLYSVCGGDVNVLIDLLSGEARSRCLDLHGRRQEAHALSTGPVAFGGSASISPVHRM
jgi:hypothetical protein